MPRSPPRLTHRVRYGKAFEAEFRNSLKYYQDLSRGEFYWFRLMDFMDFYSIHKSLQARHQPGDFMFIRKGTPYLIECKCTVETSFPFDFVTDHQMNSAESWTRAGGKAYFIIKHDLRPHGLRSKVYAVPIIAYMTVRASTLALGRKSIKWEDLSKISKELLEIKSKTWCLTPLWEQPRTYTMSQLG